MGFRAVALLVASSVALTFCACSAPARNALYANDALPPMHATGAASPIQHVVIVIQENRSFNNLFAGYPGAYTKMAGIPTKDHGTVSLWKSPMAPKGYGTPPMDIFHEFKEYQASYDRGKMDGFDRVGAGTLAHPVYGLYPLQYVDPAQVKPYWALAQQYVLADHMFQTQGSGSFEAHQDLIRGSTAIDADQSVIDNPGRNPWGCNAPSVTSTSLLTKTNRYKAFAGPYPCFTWTTLRDLLESAGLSWRYYSPEPGNEGDDLWDAFNAISAVYNGPERQTNLVHPETQILTDAAKGNLPAVSWVVPDPLSSDHLSVSNDSGPSWVAQIVNAVGSNPSLWKSTAIVIVWDDWGGLYDPLAPPQMNGTQPDYHGLGFRVPCLIVSPYVAKGVVAHSRYEFGSILRFIENNWNLGSLNTTDARANSIGGVFHFGWRPRAFAPIAAKYPAKYFLTRPASHRPLDTQ